MEKPFRVLIADKLSPRAAEIMSASSAIEVDDRTGISADELKSIISDYHGLLVRSRTKVTAELIEQASNLKVVGRAGIGVDNIDIPAASAKSILVENAPNGNSITTAEHALCLLLSLARHIPQATASMKAGRWDKKKYQGTELFEKTLGVVGLGNIGRIVAERAQGLKMKVIASDPYLPADVAEKIGVELVPFDEVMARADFLTIHAPLVEGTRGLIGADALSKVKPGVRIVNAARGGIVDETALLAALEDGRVAGAAVDVFETEPVPEGNPLVSHVNVICTPHLGASTAEAQVKVAVEVAEQMVAFAERGEVRNALNQADVAQ